MMAVSNRIPSNELLDESTAEIEYTPWRVTIDGLPTGLHIKAETEQEARRQLAIGASRLGFDSAGIELTPIR